MLNGVKSASVDVAIIEFDGDARELQKEVGRISVSVDEDIVVKAG